MRNNIIFYTCIFVLFLVLCTELLSLFNSINRFNIIIVWLSSFTIFIYILKKKFLVFKNIILIQNVKKNYLISSIIALILFITFFISFIYPPTTTDAMTYHLPRVMMWSQNNNLDFFSTPDQRMLFMPPLPGYLMLHLYLVFNNDYLFNIIQWITMFASLIAVSSITKELGGSVKSQLLAVFFAISLPMGILQSTSTQTDYIITFWFLSFIYFIILYQKDKNLKNILGLSIALGLGILSKQTMYLFSFPFLFLFLLDFKKNKKRLLNHILILIFFVSIINFGHSSRTFDVYKNFTGIHEDNVRATNEKISPKYVISNVLRNFSMNLTLPNKFYNEGLRNSVKQFHEFIDLSLSDEKNTFGKDYYVYFNTYESHAPNTLHFILLLLIITFVFSKKNDFKLVRIYTFFLLLGFLIFSIVLKWQPTGNRLLLPFFISITPIYGLIINKFFNQKLQTVLITLFFVWSLPYIFLNKTRPLLTNSDNNYFQLNFENKFKFLLKDRNILYFNNDDHSKYKIYHSIAEEIRDSKCGLIGITRGYAEIDYPLRAMIKEKIQNQNYEIVYPNVRNLTNKLDEINYSKICAYVDFRCDKNDINCTYVDKYFLSKNYKLINISKKIDLYILKI